jgi:hypothetical protein
MRIVADARRKIPRNAILTVKLCFEALKGEGGAVIPKCKWGDKAFTGSTFVEFKTGLAPKTSIRMKNEVKMSRIFQKLTGFC